LSGNASRRRPPGMTAAGWTITVIAVVIVGVLALNAFGRR
jgi:hypothetical protein